MSNYRVIISYFIRRLVFATQITETAETFVKQYLKPYLRDEILEEYNYRGYGEKGIKGRKKGLILGAILAGAISNLKGDPERKQKILEDISFEFTRPMKDRDYFVGKTGEEIVTALEQIADKKLDLSTSDAEKIISRGGGAWDEDDIANFEDMREDFIKVINNYIGDTFRNALTNMMSKERGVEDPLHLTEDIPEAEKETAEFIKDFEDFIEEKGSEYERGQSKAIKTLGFSVDDLRKFLKESPSIGTWKKPTEKDRKLYITILDSNILKSKGEEGYKTQEEIAKDFDLKDRKNVDYQTDVLKKIIKTLRAQKKHEKGEKEGADMSIEAVLPYGLVEAADKTAVKFTVKPKEEIKGSPQWNLKEKQKELETELGKKGLDRIPNKIVRLRKEIQDLKDKIYGKKEEKEPTSPALKEELQEKVKAPEILKKVVYKKTEKGDLERKKKELAEEEAKKGGERNPNKIERLKKEVEELEAKTEDQVSGSIATRSHVKLIEDAIKRHKIKAIIEFTANYDNETILKKDGPDPEKVPADFKYQKYTALFKGVKKGSSTKGTWKKTVKYTFVDGLTDEGAFEKNPKSTMELDGKTASAGDTFKKSLDEYVEKEMVAEGVLPYGQSVVPEKAAEEVKFPSRFINTKLKESYPGADNFFDLYQGLLTEDISQQKRKELVEKKKKQFGIGRSTERDILRTIKLLKTELGNTPAEERLPIEKEIKTLEERLKKVKEFPAEEESAKSLSHSRNFLLEKKKSKLEKVIEELREEKIGPKEEQDAEKIRFLERRKRTLEKAVKELESALTATPAEEKKSSISTLVGMVRNIYAVTKEYMDLSKRLNRAREDVGHFKSILKGTEPTPTDIKRIIKIHEEQQGGLTEKEKEKSRVEMKQLQELLEKLEKGWKAEDPTELKEPKEPGEEKGKGKEEDIAKKERRRLELISKHKRMLEGLVNEREKEIEEIENEMEKSEGKPGAFPETDSNAVKGLYEIFSGAGLKRLPKMTIYGWLSPVDIKELARHLQATLRAKYNKKIEDMKAQKGKSEEERERGIRKFQRAHEEELVKAKDLIKALPADLKKRRDEFKKKHPSDFQRLKEPGWVDDGGKVEEVLKSIEKELKEIKGEPKTKKQPAVNILEKTKFYSLKDFLKTGRRGLDTIAARFKRAPLEPSPMPPELKSALSSNIEKASSNYAAAKKILSDTTKALKDTEKAGEIEKLDTQFKKSEAALNGAKNILTHFETEAKQIPALATAKALLGKLEYFSSLYNYYSSILWFGEKGALPTVTKVKSAEKEFTKDDIADLEEMRDDAVETIETIAETPLSNKEEIKKESSKARKQLELFIAGYDDYPVPKAPARPPAPHQVKWKGEIPAAPVKASLPYEIVGAKKDEREKAREKSIFPGDLMKEIETLIGDLGRKDPRVATKAREELSEVKKDIKERHEGELSKKELGLIIKVEQGDLSDSDFKELEERAKAEALAMTGRVIDRVNNSILTKFIEKWRTTLKGEKVKKKSPYLNRRSPEEYEDMMDWVEGQLPGLSKEAPEPEKETPGIPTEKEIREFYEKAAEEKEIPLTKETLDQMAKLFKKEYRTKGDVPEGAGGHVKGRPKPTKIDPPKGTFEIEKEWLVKKIEKHPNGHEVIMDVLDEAMTKLKKERLKGDDFYIGKVVDGMVSLLKEILNKMKIIRVGRPESGQRLPPGKPAAPDLKGKPGGKQFSGRPDITIQTDKDAEKLFDKLIEMIETVNDYTEPDVVSVPNLKYVPPDRGKADQSYIPAGLMSFFEKPTKKSSSHSLAVQLARKFVFADNYSVDDMTEEDLITIDSEE